MTYSRRYDSDPCDAAKDAAIRAQEEGTRAGRMLLPAGINPYFADNARLAILWETARLEAAMRRLNHAR